MLLNLKTELWFGNLNIHTLIALFEFENLFPQEVIFF